MSDLSYTREKLTEYIEDFLFSHDSCDDCFREGVRYERGENPLTYDTEVHWIIRDEIGDNNPITEWRFHARSYDPQSREKGHVMSAFVYDIERNPGMKRYMKIDNKRQFLTKNNRYYIKL